MGVWPIRDRRTSGRSLINDQGDICTHLHTRALVGRKHLERDLPGARCDPVELHVDLRLCEVVDTANRRHIECVTQVDRGREDAVIDFCSTISVIRPMDHMLLRQDSGFVLPIGVRGGQEGGGPLHALRRTL